MTGIIEVSNEWLALREPEDARARSRDLALTAVSLLPAGPVVVHDLGSGTGSMMRWLAPFLPGPQTWVLHDWNPVLTASALGAARPLDHDGGPVAATARIGQLSELSAADLRGASLVTASALLDVLTSQETHAIVEACVSTGSPVLLSLSVTGSVELDPADERDGSVGRAFNAHQRRVTNDRQPLGLFGAPVARGLFKQAGWHVRPSVTSWRLDGRQPQLLREWFAGWLSAAVEQVPDLNTMATSYGELRRTQQYRGELSAVVRHLDLLAWPR